LIHSCERLDINLVLHFINMHSLLSFR
jgi:hypothetical protein